MIRLSASASDGEILAAVRRWVALLAADDYEGAFALTAHDPVVFDLPLDGVWSDLSATFALKPDNDELILVLNEIHVF